MLTHQNGFDIKSRVNSLIIQSSPYKVSVGLISLASATLSGSTLASMFGDGCLLCLIISLGVLVLSGAFLCYFWFANKKRLKLPASQNDTQKITNQYIIRKAFCLPLILLSCFSIAAFGTGYRVNEHNKQSSTDERGKIVTDEQKAYSIEVGKSQKQLDEDACSKLITDELFFVWSADTNEIRKAYAKGFVYEIPSSVDAKGNPVEGVSYQDTTQKTFDDNIKDLITAIYRPPDGTKNKANNYTINGQVAKNIYRHEICSNLGYEKFLHTQNGSTMYVLVRTYYRRADARMTKVENTDHMSEAYFNPVGDVKETIQSQPKNASWAFWTFTCDIPLADKEHTEKRTWKIQKITGGLSEKDAQKLYDDAKHEIE